MSNCGKNGKKNTKKEQSDLIRTEREGEGEGERYQELDAPLLHAWIHIVAHNRDMT